MNKKIFLLLVAMACTFTAQAKIGESSSIFSGIGIAVAFFLVMFLVLRGDILWYWKVGTIIKNQEKNNNLLKGIYNFLQEQKSKQNISQELIKDITRTSNSLVIDLPIIDR